MLCERAPGAPYADKVSTTICSGCELGFSFAIQKLRGFTLEAAISLRGKLVGSMPLMHSPPGCAYD